MTADSKSPTSPTTAAFYAQAAVSFAIALVALLLAEHDPFAPNAL